MKYARIRAMDISNGEGVGVSLFVQGCPIHCNNCFNKETWDFNGGCLWTKEQQETFYKLANRPYIRRISILGGEPLAEENADEIYQLLQYLTPLNKSVWLYTGFTWDSFQQPSKINSIRKSVVSLCDVLIDGPYIHELRNRTLKWRGSSNQRVIDVQQSLKTGEIVCLT